MTTFNELVESAKNKGFEFEAFTSIASKIYDRTNPVNDFKLNASLYGFGKHYKKLSTYLTIQMTDNTFATWEFIGAENLKFGFFSIYNQGSGSTMKSYKQEQKALKRLGL